nr:RNA polymerase-binding protein RbpA [Streptomyces griseus]
MSERALRGTRLVVTSYETDRGIDLAPRQAVEYACQNGHRFEMPFSVEAEIPPEWECKACGAQALLVDGDGPEETLRRRERREAPRRYDSRGPGPGAAGAAERRKGSTTHPARRPKKKMPPPAPRLLACRGTDCFPPDAPAAPAAFGMAGQPRLPHDARRGSPTSAATASAGRAVRLPCPSGPGEPRVVPSRRLSAFPAPQGVRGGRGPRGSSSGPEGG